MNWSYRTQICPSNSAISCIWSEMCSICTACNWSWASWCKSLYPPKAQTCAQCVWWSRTSKHWVKKCATFVNAMWWFLGSIARGLNSYPRAIPFYNLVMCSTWLGTLIRLKRSSPRLAMHKKNYNKCKCCPCSSAYCWACCWALCRLPFQGFPCHSNWAWRAGL